MSENPESVAKGLVEAIMSNIGNSIPSPDETLGARSSNTSISEILQKVADLAEGLSSDLAGVKIGDYVVSMNKSPLEIQVKQAVENYKMEAGKNLNSGIMGQGDGAENILLLVENLVIPSTTEGPDAAAEIEGDMSSFKKKKNNSLARRIWRVLRSSFSRRKN